MYAIIRMSGRQYRAEVDQTIDIDRIPQEVGDEIELNEVLLIGDGDNTIIGQPHVEGAKVLAKVEVKFRGDKVQVFKYRQRTNYRRWRGHRQYHTRLRITSISVN